MAKSIDNTDDVIDSRDIIERIEALRDMDERDEDESAELAGLEKLAKQCEDFDDWEYGLGLVRDSYFVQHAQELADDIGAVDRNAKWPMNCIDWDLAARELQHDYTPVDFDGVTYWVRS